MQEIQTDTYKIQYNNDLWRIVHPKTLKTTTELGHPFEAIRNDNILRYKTEFASQRNFPGNTLDVRFVRAVLVAYHDKSQRWMVGLHLARDEQAKPVFRPLVEWNPTPPHVHQEVAKQAGRALAGTIGVPLKIFGDKKTPRQDKSPQQMGVTGPLQPHQRQTIDSRAVALKAEKIKLPIEGAGFKLESGRNNGRVLRVTREMPAGKVEAPVYDLCEFNPRKKSVRLVAPTGLLGSFLGGNKGRDIPFDEIGNLEYRVIHTLVPREEKSKRGEVVERMIEVYIWGLYLTLQDESLMLVQISYEPKFLQNIKQEIIGADKKRETAAMDGLNYFRAKLAEENAIEAFSKKTEQAAYVLAAVMGKRMVRTQVGDLTPE